MISPIGFVAAWLVLGPRRRLRLAVVPAAFILPAAWIVVTFVRGAIVDLRENGGAVRTADLER